MSDPEVRSLAEAKKQNYLHGAAILAAGVVVLKILGAIYKIPLRNIIGETGYGYFFAAYTIYNFFLTISTAGKKGILSTLPWNAENPGAAILRKFSGARGFSVTIR